MNQTVSTDLAEARFKLHRKTSFINGEFKYKAHPGCQF